MSEPEKHLILEENSASTEKYNRGNLSHGLYRKRMPETLKQLFDRFCQDTNALDLSSELALLKAMMADAIGRLSEAETQWARDVQAVRERNEREKKIANTNGTMPVLVEEPRRPEPDLDGFARIVEAIGRAGDRQAARQWNLNPRGAEEVARLIAEAVAGALEGQPPEVIAKVRKALDSLRVPWGAMELRQVGVRGVDE